MSNKKLKHIYWFAYYNLYSPSVRYRAKYPLEYAGEKLGITSCLVIPGYSIKRLIHFTRAYLSALFFPRNGSLIVIQRVQSNFIYSSLLKLLVVLRKNKTLYDLDDADYLEHQVKTIHFFAKNCKYISAGSDEIKKYLLQFNKNVFYLTSPTPDLGIVKQSRNKIFTIGWIGGFGGGHKESMYHYVLPAIKALPFDCKFILLGIIKTEDEMEIMEYFRESGHVHLELPKNIDWQNERALQKRIALFDIGVATLLDEPVQLAKSGIKAKQYMNNGIPVLCNDLPENNKVVLHGHNGFICNKPEEFKNRMIQFREMPDKEYWQFSKNARLSIRDFNHAKYFEILEKIKGGVWSEKKNESCLVPIMTDG